MIGDRGGLAIAELIFYVPALVMSIVVASKHGFGRSAGWYFLIILSVSRIAGQIAQLVAVNQPTNESAQVAAAVLSSVGFSTLLAAQIGLLKRPNEGMSHARLPPRLFNLLFLPILAALIFGIVGATDSLSSSSASSRQNAQTLSKASGILFLVIFVVMTGVALITLSMIGGVIPGDRKLVFAVVASEPFLLVRVIYLLLTNFAVNPSLFSNVQGNVIVQAFMSVLEEFIVMILYLGAGYLAPSISRDKVQAGYHRSGGVEAANGQQTLNLRPIRR